MILTPRDWQAIAQREASDLLGTQEGAAKLAEAKRYGALADMIEQQHKEIERLKAGPAAMNYDEWFDENSADLHLVAMKATGREIWNAAAATTRQSIVESIDDAELMAWVLSHPETCAECLQDAAAGEALGQEDRNGVALERGADVVVIH